MRESLEFWKECLLEWMSIFWQLYPLCHVCFKCNFYPLVLEMAARLNGGEWKEEISLGSLNLRFFFCLLCWFTSIGLSFHLVCSWEHIEYKIQHWYSAKRLAPGRIEIHFKILCRQFAVKWIILPFSFCCANNALRKLGCNMRNLWVKYTLMVIEMFYVGRFYSCIFGEKVLQNSI